MRSLYYCATLVVLGASPAQSQTIPPVVPLGLDSSRVLLTAPPQDPALTSAGPDGRVAIIVEFIDPPTFRAGVLPGIAPPAPEQRFSELSRDMAGLAGASVLAGTGPEIRQRFTRLFFGAAARVAPSLVPALTRLPYVKSVHPDREAQAYLEKSVAHIRAPEVWQTRGTRGAGVRVGIIDSGIDYLHPALGGGFGTGFKVAGGYDFVNGDADPLDDNGHGTHVAGIVAANGGGMLGVAPEATLYAWKVLNAEGHGPQSSILAAIERCADPNDDGDPADHLDVVNMSLGSPNGKPDDPLCTAVDNASHLGVVFVVAAGNDGNSSPPSGKEDNYFYDGSATIGTPGAAREALTVGAVDSVDALGYFSSKGPVHATFAAKPDVVAPGVNITAPFLGGTTQALSGTSMAAPHVAGVAALLRALYPSWSVEQIRSAIIHTARDLGLKKLHQGTGLVDAVRAAASRTFVTPASLGFGLDDGHTSSWTGVDTMFVINGSAESRSYTASASTGNPGILVTAEPGSFSLAAGAQQMLKVTVQVNNLAVPATDNDIDPYAGLLRLTGGGDTLAVPWVLVRSNVLSITFSDPITSFLGFSEDDFFFASDRRARWASETRLDLLALQSGQFSLVAQFRRPSAPDRLVIREGIPFSSGSSSVFVQSADAIHPVRFDGVNHAGRPLAGDSGSVSTLITELPMGLGALGYTSMGLAADTILVSPASTGFRFHGLQSRIDLVRDHTMHLVPFASFQGMGGAHTLTNDPAGYFSQNLEFHGEPDQSHVRITAEVASATPREGTWYHSTLFLLGGLLPLPGPTPAAIALYLTPSSDPGRMPIVGFHVNFRKTEILNIQDYETPFVSVVGDSMMAGVPSSSTTYWHRSPRGGTLTFGNAPAHPVSLFYNNSFGPGSSIQFRQFFKGMLRENRFPEFERGTYTITNASGDVVARNPLNEEVRTPLPVPAGVYSLVADTRGPSVRGRQQTIQIAHRFDLRSAFPDPPVVYDMYILNSGGRVTNGLLRNESAEVRFNADLLNPAAGSVLGESTLVSYRKHGLSLWLPLPVRQLGSGNDGKWFAADLSPTALQDSAGIDLRISVADAHGNATSMVFAPAMSVGAWNGEPATGVEEPGDDPVPAEFALLQNYPNPCNPATTIQWTLVNRVLTTLKVYDLIGREVATLVNEVKGPGTYSVRFDGSHLASGVYYYRLQAGDFVATRKLMLLK